MEKLAIEVQNQMLLYATDLFHPPAEGPSNQRNPTTADTADHSDPPVEKGQVQLETEDGLPVMPAVVEDRNIRKAYLVELVRKYLTAHYGE
jgi:hypothetical protein